MISVRTNQRRADVRRAPAPIDSRNLPSEARRYSIVKMNALLEKALAEVARLPEEEQEVIATLILDEIAAERG